eukprot:Hpha_TRINITY_DN15133_c8_g6::TRINITY_DN15133_c8_g6_i1::g.127025::m.127025/K01869/LARS, leuS; leucyl-tRNA synthetase
MSSDAKTRADVGKIAGQIDKQLKEKGQPFLGGQRPSREDVTNFQRLFGGAQNTSLVRWGKHMAAFRPEDRNAWAGPAASPATVASVPVAAAKGQKAGYSSAAEKPQGKAAAAAAKPQGEQKSGRRDLLIELELKAQKRWDEMKAFEIDPPAEGEEDTGKFMATFPYPYMNGKLHFGHCFTVTKAEFAVSFHRSLGKRSIFPFGFHCTGMPIQAAANKLKKEYSIYGMPYPTFPSGKPHTHPSAEGKAGSVKLVWSAPTSTGKDRSVTGYIVESRVADTGDGAKDWAKAAEVSADISDVSYDGIVKKRVSGEVSGLDAKTGYEFRVIAKLSDHTTCQPSAVSETIEPATGEKKKGAKGGPQVKAKIAAKSGDALHQWDIMRSMGIAVEDIPAFQEPIKWLQHFPPEGAADLKRFGSHIDFRRTFITTAENQYYDKFIRWQFRKLKEADRIAFGKRPTVYSETDKQACMDHDRAEGEGVGPQEYTGIKMKVLDPRPAVLADIPADKKISLVAATLRPETMCGQTNAWILPEGKYGCFDAGNGEVFVCSHRAARNMSFQDLFPEWGKMTCVKELHGKDLLGCAVHAPTSPYERVFVLPLLTIKMDKGTGIVTSVPADSPDDYATFMELKNSPGKRAHYGVKDEWIDGFDLIPIINCEIDGEIRTHSAQYMCEKLGVKSQKDTVLLLEAHDVVYKAGFYKGIMSAGPFKGEKVQTAKDKTQAMMKVSGEAIVYHEPAGNIVGRSGDECVIALIDQWYLKYGEKTWRDAIEGHINAADGLDTYSPATKAAFLQATGWLKEWACSRSFGLGTKIPWDEQFVIESLSDSTVYMAYYAIAKYLQGADNYDGKKIGPSGIKPDQLNDAVFDYIFLRREFPKDCTIPEAKMKEMRREFEFWYPMDLRVSGKDLIQNHLTFCLYNHAAIWKDQPKMWPKSFFTNGWILVNGEKMSKQKGNFFTLRQACDRFSADACRLTCAGAGDGLEDANFEEKNAEAAILRLSGFVEWSKKTITKVKEGGFRKGDAELFVDKWFKEEMRRLIHAARRNFERMVYREASICGWFDFLSARDIYIDACPEQPSAKLLLEWIEHQTVLISIFCPHVGEHVWELLGKEGSILNARFPSPPAADTKVLEQGRYLFRTVKEDLLSKKEKALKKQPKLKIAKVYVAVKYPEWKVSVLDTLNEDWKENGNAFSKTVMKKFDPKSLPEGSVLKAKGKNVGIFAAFVMQDAKERGATAFSKELPFDEFVLLRENKDWLLGKSRLEDIQFLPSDSADASTQEQAAPGHPAILFE